MAWQFDRPDLGDGMVQAFRRDKSDYETVRVKLHGLEADAVYVLTDLDLPGISELTGRELTDRGLPVTIQNRRGAAIITYHRAK